MQIKTRYIKSVQKISISNYLEVDVNKKVKLNISWLYSNTNKKKIRFSLWHSLKKRITSIKTPRKGYLNDKTTWKISNKFQTTNRLLKPTNPISVPIIKLNINL